VIRNRFYYSIKPLLHRSVKLAVRGWFARRKRERVMDTWPIMPGSERPPTGWPGWPEGKQFALVLTHDVEGQGGLDKCRKLMELERKLGFRSCFNLVPLGDYRASREFREELVAKGFEVGVHDLYHNGKLFLTRREFNRNAPLINQHLADWGAVGFRSGFMLRQPGWLHDLNLLYDASTFDSDPFEPQPEGMGTIFPFWVPGPAAQSAKCKVRGSEFELGRLSNSAPGPQSPAFSAPGYVELPYTLPQDSTLFLVLRERHPDIWLQKLAWIARHGGMALVNVHPDYLRFEGEAESTTTFPVERYVHFLQYARERYGDAFWHPLPREVAAYVVDYQSQMMAKALPMGRALAKTYSRLKPKVWIDLDNTPHVPFFQPIMDELKSRGFPVVVTARDAFQVCDLADEMGVPYVKVGHHYGKSRFLKAFGLVYRALQLAPFVRKEKPRLGVSHGARSQLLLCNYLRIPTVLIEDYEYAQFPPSMHPTWVMAPSVIPEASLCGKNGQVRKYPGIKEDVYAWRLKPDSGILAKLGLSASDIVVTVRPPATEAHYHSPESEKLFAAFMKRACRAPSVKIVLLPRNKKQGEAIKSQAPQWFEEGKTIIPSGPLNGMNLLWHSDLVVSGGGTMNREAAALGIPVYSIFRGATGAVDQHLAVEGRLVLIKSTGEIEYKINLSKRVRKPISEVTSTGTLMHIVDMIQQIAEGLEEKTTRR